MVSASWFSNPGVIPSLYSLTSIKWTVAKLWNVTSKSRMGSDGCDFLFSYTLWLFSLSCSGETTCFVVSCPVERPTGQGKDGGPCYQLTRSQEARPSPAEPGEETRALVFDDFTAIS